ncbi:MAG TPA: hypothetical protein VMJ32_08645 [Pirellulales bacterium]|nr:hypothetical protein [Pirellulales bacterium]
MADVEEIKRQLRQLLAPWTALEATVWRVTFETAADIHLQEHLASEAKNRGDKAMAENLYGAKAKSGRAEVKKQEGKLKEINELILQLSKSIPAMPYVSFEEETKPIGEIRLPYQPSLPDEKRLRELVDQSLRVWNGISSVG